MPGNVQRRSVISCCSPAVAAGTNRRCSPPEQLSAPLDKQVLNTASDVVGLEPKGIHRTVASPAAGQAEGGSAKKSGQPGDLDSSPG